MPVNRMAVCRFD